MTDYELGQSKMSDLLLPMIAKLEAENKDLIEYVQHKEDCFALTYGKDIDGEYYQNPRINKCTCGLSETLLKLNGENYEKIN